MKVFLVCTRYLEGGGNAAPGVLDAMYEVRLEKTDDEHLRFVVFRFSQEKKKLMLTEQHS